MNNLLPFILTAVLLTGYSPKPNRGPSRYLAAPYSPGALFQSPVSKPDTFTHLHAYKLFGIADSIIENEGYKNAFEYLNKYEKFYTEPMEKDMFCQVMMTYASMIGNTEVALTYESLHIPNKSTGKYEFSGEMVVKSAKELIMERCIDKQVVMLNEAHHRGQHRAFIRSLLNDFYKMGFRYFLVEAYSAYDDPELNERKYPLPKTGTYIKEPAFGQLIREAIAIGFDVAAYDTDTADCDSDVPDFCRNELSGWPRKISLICLKRIPKPRYLLLPDTITS